MQEKKNLSSSKKGMIRDTDKELLQQQQYPFSLNSTLESEAGDAFNLINEPSNLLNVRFENGFRVVGYKNDVIGEKTYFFLTNPDTKVSQIGYVDNSKRGAAVDEASPLETQTQIPYSEFVLLLEDECNLCLNFNIDFPLKKIALKDEKCGKTLYWADNLNPDRYLNLDKLSDYKKKRVEIENCIEEENTITYEPREILQYVCPEGYSYDEIQEACVKTDKSNACPDGFTYDPVENICIGKTEFCDNGIDVSIILDITGSMQTPFESIRDSLNTIVNNISNRFSDDYRISLTTVTDGNPKFTNQVSFSQNNVSAVQTALNNVSIGGGGDRPEPTDLALESVLNGGAGVFREDASKVIFLVTDAPPSGNDDTYTEGVDDEFAKDLADQALSKDIQIFPIATGAGVTNDFAEAIRSVHNYYAETTRGRAYYTESGVVSGNINDAIEQVECTVTQEPDCDCQITAKGECVCEDTQPATIDVQYSCGRGILNEETGLCERVFDKKDDCGCYEEEPICVDCDKLRIDKKHILPTITATSIENGGELERGVYEFMLTYSDKLGNEIAEYVSITNPIHIFDSSRKTITSEELADPTNQAIKLRVENLDTQYKYYKVAIVQKLAGSVSYFTEAIHPINDKDIIVSTVRDKERIDLNKLLAQKTTYVKSEGLTSSNGYLFRYGLTAEKEWNLQPIANLLGGFLRWQTVEAKEDLYERGEASSLYKGYYRDEVYPFAIRFETKTGYKTALFPLISRPAESYFDETSGRIIDELSTVENKDTESLTQGAINCSTEERNKYWQFYNTAHDVKRCENFNSETTNITQEVFKYCTSENFDSLKEGIIYLDISEVEKFLDLRSYIEEYGNNMTFSIPEDILEEYDNEELELLLNDIRSDINCTPVYDEDKCGNPIVEEENIFLGDIVNEEVSLTPKQPEDYRLSRLSKNNFIHRVRQEDGRGKRDERYEGSLITSDAYPFEREVTVDAEKCAAAIEIPQKNKPIEGTIGYVTQSYGAETIAELQDPYTTETGGRSNFTSNIHKGALWIKSSISLGDRAFIEIPTWREAQFDDLFSDTNSEGSQPTLGNHIIRISIFTGRCNNLKFVKTYFADVRDGAFFIEDPILSEDLINNEFYAVVDVPIEEIQNGYTTAVLNGTFGLEIRAEEYESAIISFDELFVNKQQKYSLECDFEVPVFDECDPQPYQSGKFSYWESIVNYPDNKELYDSSELVIKEEHVDASIKKDFEKYYSAAKINGKYLLKQATDFRCKPIRHFKFPDFNVAPFMSTNPITPFTQTRVYPLGVTIDKQIVKDFLDVAVENNLISQSQREDITGFEIFRGDRRVDKGILGKGLAFDMYEYEQQASGDKTLFSNFPFNDLGDNKLLYKSEDRNEFIDHPFQGNRNNKFTVHSPDYDYYDLQIGQEAKIESYQYGNSRGEFAPVENHSEWVILGDKSYRTANRLAILEYSLEAAIRFVENTIQTSQNYWFLVGVSSGGNPAGAITSSIATALFTAFDILGNAVPVIGRYRYEWLQVFRNMGKPNNFAYKYAAEGFYNYAEPNNWYESIARNNLGNTLRSINTGKALKEGKYTFTEKDGRKLKVNNLDRERSLFLSFGEDFEIEYPASYKNYDNGNIDSYGSSRTTQQETGLCDTGISSELQKNVASPYVSIKNYVPFQYNDISSVKWLSATKTIKLDNDTSCYAIFGGDIYISRYAIKRKTPLFTATAFGLAPYTPYQYSDNNNYGVVRYYADYELGGEKDLEDILFPDFASDYVFDCQTSESGSYIKPPSKFYLYYYGIPNFLVESEINLNLRYGKPDPKDSFWPEAGDYTDWTQENNVSIREPNKLFYNNVYSSTVTQTAYRTLPDYFNQKEFDCIYDSPNGVIYSMQDTSENDLTDPWLVYRPLDYHQFPTSYGKLIDLKGIESSQVLGRFENTSVVFNAVNQFKDAQDAASRELGTGGIFAARPIEFSNTELGYGGSQTYQIVSNEFGHFYPDAEKGQVFQVRGTNIEEISSVAGGQPVGMKSWFKEHLPFKIKNSIIENYANQDTDNALNGVGIAMGWDSKFDRVFLTKKDYKPKQELFYCGGKFLDMDCNPIEYCHFDNKEQTIQNYLDQGYRYIEEDCQLIFQKYIESCTYSFEFCQFDNREQQEANLVNQGYSFKRQDNCTLIYEKTEEVCDLESKQSEIQDLLDEGYEYYTPVDCDYTNQQTEINNLLNDGYTEVSDINCTKTFEKEVIECDMNSKQSEIDDLLSQGFTLVSQAGCELIFEKNTDITAVSNGTSTIVGELIDIQGGLSLIEGVSNGVSTSSLNLGEVTPPLLQGGIAGVSVVAGELIDVQPNTFIGEVSSVIQTKENLANVLGIPSDIILYFNINGGEVQANISEDYTINLGKASSPFPNTLTYYKDISNKVTALGSYIFTYTDIEDLDLNGVIVTEGYLTRYTDVKRISLPYATNIGSNAFYDNYEVEVIYIPRATSLGSNSANNSVFYFVNLRPNSVTKIYVHPSLETNNNGDRDGDIVYADNRGAEIIYVDNFIEPDNITDLSYTVSGSNINIDFSSPNSTNTIDFYEVYVNEIYKERVQTTTETISGLSNGDRVYIYARDIYYNGGKSNEITINGL